MIDLWLEIGCFTFEVDFGIPKIAIVIIEWLLPHRFTLKAKFLANLVIHSDYWCSCFHTSTESTLLLPLDSITIAITFTEPALVAPLPTAYHSTHVDYPIGYYGYFAQILAG